MTAAEQLMVARQQGVQLWLLALITALIPLVTIHTTFVVSIIEGYVSWCIPYWDSCTSISRTGRHGSSYFIFKGTMLPGAVLGMVFWWLNALWLRHLGCMSRGWIASIPFLGLVSGFSLMAYTLALGHAGDAFEITRRAGVMGYFALTYIAQLLLSATLREHIGWGRTGQHLLWLCQFTFCVGIFSVILSVANYDYYKTVDNAFEWVLALLINIHALWVALLWRRSRFHARLWVG